jgi:hypothetical protein
MSARSKGSQGTAWMALISRRLDIHHPGGWRHVIPLSIIKPHCLTLPTVESSVSEALALESNLVGMDWWMLTSSMNLNWLVWMNALDKTHFTAMNSRDRLLPLYLTWN